MDVSTTKIYLDTPILASSNKNQREYLILAGGSDKIVERT
jgi:hypothetical protein